MPTYIDMFSGAGLFSAGMSAAGFTQALAVEVDRSAARSYARNVSSNVLCRSVLDAPEDMKADILLAGPPCQGFSTLGRRDPLDARNALSLAILPWVDRAQPSVVVIENVPPFLKSMQWQMLRDALSYRGFDVTAWELDAADFGVAQFRRRAFTIASRIGQPAPPAPCVLRKTVREVFDKPISHADPLHVWPKPSALALQRIMLVPPGGDKRDVLRAQPDLCPPSWAEVGCQATDVWGRIKLDQPANTLRCSFLNPSKGRYIHPTENRVLSLREGARLQGIPDHWSFQGELYPIARQIGNGVPVPLAQAVGLAVGTLFGMRREIEEMAEAA
jgi:DNA (cytosine-5)-methyltransferase 1